MGFRFSIEHANWLAHVLQPSGATPQLHNNFEKSETLKLFLDSFSDDFFTSQSGRYEVENLMKSLRRNGDVPLETLNAIQDYFRSIPWVALILPSGINPEVDLYLTDSTLLEKLVRIRPEDPGLILQLKNPPHEVISLENVFPAFKVAFSEVTRWPGVLLWNPHGDAVFLDIGENKFDTEKRLFWIFEQLAQFLGIPDLGLLKVKFKKKFSTEDKFGMKGLTGVDSVVKPSLPVRILHLSDLHLGSTETTKKLARVQVLIQSLIKELGDDGPIVPVITGDLMDTPTEENLGLVRSFITYLKSLGIEPPVVVLGNHDVRDDGWLGLNLNQAMNIQTSPVIKMPEHSIAFLCFDSARGDFLARGEIADSNLEDIGNELDLDPNWKKYTLIGAVHHHPIPVERPIWYKQEWYEKFIGKSFEKTETLINADKFLKWLKIRKVTAVLHGHKHIPRFDKHDEIAIVGCGSTMGKVRTQEEGQTYMSINIITVDTALKRIAFRLRAEQIPGAGLESVESHEVLMRSEFLE